MKKESRILGVVALAIVLALPANGSGMKEKIGKVKYDRAVANLLVGIKSDNCGLRKSAAHMLGEMEATDAVIPLMEVLHTCSDEPSRIAAAWALCRIGDGRGVFAVKQSARLDSNRKVQLSCAWFYNLYVRQGTFTFVPPVDPPIEMSVR
jgi:HEAT repeat protein